MLGRTAGGLFWMFRNLERAENSSRLVETGLRISLTRSSDASGEWHSMLETNGVASAYLEKYGEVHREKVIDFLLRDPDNPQSILNVVANARNNAREVRTALTKEVWEATNGAWLNVTTALNAPVPDHKLPEVLAEIRSHTVQVRGALHGTMLRNDIYNFSRLGTFIERSDNTARIVDSRYYVLLPNPHHVGHSQWETVLRACSALRAFQWQSEGKTGPSDVANFLLLDERLPRSLIFCHKRIAMNLRELCALYGETTPASETAEQLRKQLMEKSINDIFAHGLHEFLLSFIAENNTLALQIEDDYRFVR